MCKFPNKVRIKRRINNILLHENECNLILQDYIYSINKTIVLITVYSQ